MLWTLEKGLELVRSLERALAPHYHAALAGGVLMRGESKHDLDVVVYPHQADHFELDEIHTALSTRMRLVVPQHKVAEDWRKRGITDTKHVEVWAVEGGKRVDIIILGANHAPQVPKVRDDEVPD